MPWEKVREHRFENLIALCPTCHTRYDLSKDMDRLAMQQYKINLGVLNDRYGPLELQALNWLADDPTRERVAIPRGMIWAFGNLVTDGLVEFDENPPTWATVNDGTVSVSYLLPTDLGRDAAMRIREGRPIDELS
ncbi:hypothetical protein EHYA_01730 [Embleya hyalina]|uniref:HNH domain-containing protein n=1 Tax=Embleya hyalina TaxID=516124 RepID=A0A401YHH8_9ACTN|nr:hypothetical protein EHYA_01730 [Embleya hyalina]